MDQDPPPEDLIVFLIPGMFCHEFTSMSSAIEFRMYELNESKMMVSWDFKLQ